MKERDERMRGEGKIEEEKKKWRGTWGRREYKLIDLQARPLQAPS